MIPEFPTTRVEAYLAKILGQDTELPVPQTRLDLFLAKIAGMDVETPVPQARKELFLAKILGEAVDLPAPQTRIEEYLAKVAGLDVATPVPLTRVDFYLDEWAAGGGAEYETVTGAIASFTTLRAAPVSALSVAINPVQSGSGNPSPDNVRPISGWTGVNVWVRATHDTSVDPTVEVTFPTPPGTVYGGTLDVLTGVLTVDRAIRTGSELSFVAVTGSNYATFRTGAVSGIKSDSAEVCVISSAYKGMSFNAASASGDNYAFVSSNQIRIKDTAHAALSADEFKALVADVQFVYKLATPQTIQLDPETLSTLLGENNIWADTGDVTVTYRSN